jgi:hypothetical protein
MRLHKGFLDFCNRIDDHAANLRAHRRLWCLGESSPSHTAETTTTARHPRHSLQRRRHRSHPDEQTRPNPPRQQLRRHGPATCQNCYKTSLSRLPCRWTALPRSLRHKKNATRGAPSSSSRSMRLCSTHALSLAAPTATDGASMTSSFSSVSSSTIDNVPAWI